MTLILVGGNPENRREWDKILAELGREDAVALDLPGLGCPRPEGFGATRWDYKDWLVSELSAYDHPVDVIAHSMGGMMVCGILNEQPELIRSFVTGTVAHGEFAVHERARIWQTTRYGEAFRDSWETLTHEQRCALLRDGQVPEERLDDIAQTIDYTMIDCLLSWYRSAAWTGDWQLRSGVDYPPGLFLWGRDDPFQKVSFGLRTAEAIGADITVFDNCGHWWMTEQPHESATAIKQFWNTL